ncbi:MAG: tetratricopeptide repeat protein [Candidatus Nitrosocosmicus sp.]
MLEDEDNTNKDGSNKYKDPNQNNNITTENISINKNHLDSLDPKFKNSIEDFIKVLNGHLNDVQLSKEQKKLLEKQIEDMAMEIKKIPSYKKIESDLCTDSTKSSSGYNNQAIECCDKALEINHMSNDDHYNKGLSLYYLGDYNQAIECYDKALEINPQNADAHNNKGLSLYYLGDYNQAIECYDKALEINPQFSCAHNNKGLSLYYLGDYNQAIECYDKALEINPQNADSYYNKAQALSTIEKYAEAIECYDKALELESDNVNALNKKAWYLVNYFPTRLIEASETIKKAIGLDPTNNNIMHTYGYTLDKLKTYEEAIVVYEHIIKQKPLFSNVWYDCARSKIKLNDKNIHSCIYNLQKAIDLNPAYKEKAKDEIDFQDIKNNPDFKKILGF